MPHIHAARNFGGATSIANANRSKSTPPLTKSSSSIVGTCLDDEIEGCLASVGEGNV
jgi:hypothetical protein